MSLLLLLAIFEMLPDRLPTAYLGQPYTGGPLTTRGGGLCPRNVVSMRVVGGALPPGVQLGAGGYLRGTPAQPGFFTFRVRVANDCVFSDHEVTLEVVRPPALAVHPSALEYKVPFGEAMRETIVLEVSSDTAPMAYAVEVPEFGWVRAAPQSGWTQQRSPDAVQVKLETARLPPGTHRSEIRLSAWRLADPPVVPVTITVTPPLVATMPSPAPRQLEPRPLPPIVLPPAPPRRGPAQTVVRVAAGRSGASPPNRHSRSATLRNLMTATAKAPPPAPPAKAPPAEAQAKPSPLGKPVEHPPTRRKSDRGRLK